MVAGTTSTAILSILIALGLTAMISTNFDIRTFATKSNSQLEQIPSELTDFPGSDPSLVDVDVTSASKSSIGSYHVKGAIKNLGDVELDSVRVTAFFYDNNNQTVGVTTCCYTDPSTIEPGRTATFDSFAQEDDFSGTPESYRLSFDWG